jgi:hypothetical protein
MASAARKARRRRSVASGGEGMELVYKRWERKWTRIQDKVAA